MSNYPWVGFAVMLIVVIVFGLGWQQAHIEHKAECDAAGGRLITSGRYGEACVAGVLRKW